MSKQMIDTPNLDELEKGRGQLRDGLSVWQGQRHDVDLMVSWKRPTRPSSVTGRAVRRCVRLRWWRSPFH